MIQRGKIPKQANFTSLNPHIRDSTSRRLLIPTDTNPWTVSPKVALVNNYGAAGSNAAILVREQKQAQSPDSHPIGTFPITIAARSRESLERYIDVLRLFLDKKRPPLPVVAHNISKRQNHSLYYRAAFTASNLESLLTSLEKFSSVGEIDAIKAGRPVILSFGGQTGQTVCLSRALYDESDLLQKHMVSEYFVTRLDSSRLIFSLQLSRAIALPLAVNLVYHPFSPAFSTATPSTTSFCCIACSFLCNTPLPRAGSKVASKLMR